MIVPFTPNNQTTFQFQATLDGGLYTCRVPWNVYGQRYYLDVRTPQGRRIALVARTGSPDGFDINLVGGYFTTSKIVFREPSQQFEITP